MKDNKVVISLEITPELKEVLRVKAFEERVSVSELIRRVLINNLIAPGEKDNGSSE